MSVEKLRNDREVMRDEFVMRERIIRLLRTGPKTVPELAAALSAPTREVLFWVMGMRRYGLVEEHGKASDEGYFAYGLAQEV